MARQECPDPASAPPYATAAKVRLTPGLTLRRGTPEEAGLLPGRAQDIARAAERYTLPSPLRPAYPGVVVLAARHGVVVAHHACGDALRYAAWDPVAGRATELPPALRVPMRPDTVFDLASVSKLFTSIAVLQQAERGLLDLDAPVAVHLPSFAAAGKERITVRSLLTHTSGLPAWLPLHRDLPTPEARYEAVHAVRPAHAPGTRYLYSDLNLIVLGALVERVTGAPLDRAVAEGITGPLGMADTGYRPPRECLPRIAATEYLTDPYRGMVRGEVHDENAWSLGGVAGHAGVFSTARDLAVLAQTVLGGGSYGDTRVLTEASVRAMLTDHNRAFPSHAHGLGFELDQPWYMGPLASPVTAGHTGFTGTLLMIDPRSGCLLVLLANRVHPTRDGGPGNAARRAVATALWRALRS